MINRVKVSANEARTMNYRPEIDGLRAIAVLSVLLGHAGIGFFTGGFLGVDVFFVISGYLICHLITEQLAKKQFSFTQFYERRIRRLFPALFLVTLVSFIVARQWMLYNDFRQFSQSITAVYTLMPNIFFWDQVGYFSIIADFQPLLHSWSLGIEEQFYLMFPLLLVATYPRLHSRLSIALLALLLVSGVMAGILWQSSADTSSAFYLLPSRFWEFLAGAVLALPVITANRVDSPVATVASVLGLLGIVFGVLAYTPNNSNPGMYIASTVVATSVLLYFTHPGKLVSHVLCSRPLINTGLASYSIYLWHQPVFVFARIRFGEAVNHTFFSWVLILLVVFLVWLTWKFVEQPFRGSGLLSRHQVFSVATGLTICSLVVGLAGHFSNAILPPKNLELSQRLEQAVGLSQDCDGRVGVSDCQTHQQPEIIVFGDSYAMQWVDGLLNKDPDIRMAQLTLGGCGPYIGGEAVLKQCENFRVQAGDWIGRTRSIRTALLSTNLHRDLSIATDGGGISLDVAEGIVLRQMDETIELLRERGIEPVFIRPPPVAYFNTGACLARAELFDDYSVDCHFSERADQATLASQQRVLTVLSREIRVVDWWPEVCSGDNCLAEIDGVFMFSDNRHLTKRGSVLLGQRIALLQ